MFLNCMSDNFKAIKHIFVKESIKEARRLGEEVEKSYRSLDKSKRGYQRAFQVTIDYLGQLSCLRF